MLLLNPFPALLQRLMSNLALAKIRTGVAAAIAEDRDAAVQRKSELLLGPVPFDPTSLLSPEDLKAAAAAAATPEPTMVTSTGRRVKVGVTSGTTSSETDFTSVHCCPVDMLSSNKTTKQSSLQHGNEGRCRPFTIQIHTAARTIWLVQLCCLSTAIDTDRSPS